MVSGSTSSFTILLGAFDSKAISSVLDGMPLIDSGSIGEA